MAQSAMEAWRDTCRDTPPGRPAKIYDVVELSAMMSAHTEVLIALNKDLREARQRIAYLEDHVTRP